VEGTVDHTIQNHTFIGDVQAAHTLADAVLLESVHAASDLGTGSYAMLGHINLPKSAREVRQRRRKTFVQKVFLDLVSKFSEDELQKLLWLDFYQELCDRITPHYQDGIIRPNFLHRPASPYFVTEQKAERKTEVRHAALKARFLKMANRRLVKIKPRDRFQLACTLGGLWEGALRIWEQGQYHTSTIFALAEKMTTLARALPKACSPFEDKKNLVHISSLKIPSKTKGRRFSPTQIKHIREFGEASLAFGYEYYGLAETASAEVPI